MPCIRCGACAEACPVQLQPQLLLRQLCCEDFRRAEADGVFDCSECGRCDAVCPSHIPLLLAFRNGKSEIRHRASRLTAANAARDRFEARQRRLLREASESALRQSERKSQVANPDAVAAAVERARARRQAQSRDSEP